jgi:plasmid stability protein
MESDVKMRLRLRAERHGKSIEEEVRNVPCRAVRKEEASLGGLGTEIAALFAKVPLKIDIAELRGRRAQPVSFD